MDYSDYIKSVMSGCFNMIDGMEEASRDLAKLSKKELKKLIKEAEKLIRERCEDTSGYKAENEDINNDPKLSDREKRIAICESRRRYEKQFMDFQNEMDRWNREIREEEERRVKLAEQARLKKLAKLYNMEDLEEESEAESESESEDFGPDDSDSD